MFHHTKCYYKHLAPNTQDYHCPYNVSHTMPCKTLTKHLTKCPDKPKDYVNCTFNILHVMPKYELMNHENNCPDRILLDTFMNESEDMVRPLPVIQNQSSVQYNEEESWDDIECTSDVLSTINKSTSLMKAKHGITKSERKTYRTLLHSLHNATP